ncbi:MULTISPECIES: hypothetical protein [Paenibacillus]|uniref:hypothetical protein n=1 Tax=Paenibacillus TaxID=44249 RepID=UPI000CFA2BE3|nr:MULTISPECIES: hypothetical protein [Paenibacillus]MBJ9992848.1 hypothetical protein [Paenibacillus sp. S28]MEC0179392.1 hypothetical protein [Paenibacillus favisporus]PQP85820.1 hypothetical protein CPT76_32510 [Paenibacillus sp. AR247]
MQQSVTRKHAQKFVGKHIVAAKKDGSLVTGKLLRISGNRLILQRNKGKKVHTKAIIPLVLFDLLAIGTAPYAYGPYGGFGGVPYGGFGPGYGPGFGPAGYPKPYGGGFW